MTRRYSSGWIFSNGANTDVNATFTHTSMGPSSASTRSAAAKTCAWSATSTGITSGLAAGVADLPGGAGQPCLAAGEQRDGRAAGAERRGDRPADAAAGPGDHHDLCSHRHPSVPIVDDIVA